MNICEDFQKASEAEACTIDKYRGLLPEELIEAWRRYGYGDFMNGYLKMVNPDEFSSLVVDTYMRSEGTIPIFATAMGDMILFEKDENEESYVIMVNYRKGKTKVLASKYSLFLAFLEETAFRQRALDWLPYPEAVASHGRPAYDECFGYVPLLGAGGEEDVRHMKKVKFKEHVLAISEFMGPVR